MREAKFSEPVVLRLAPSDHERIRRINSGMLFTRSATIREALRYGLDHLEREMRQRWAGERPEDSTVA